MKSYRRLVHLKLPRLMWQRQRQSQKPVSMTANASRHALSLRRSRAYLRADLTLTPDSVRLKWLRSNRACALLSRDFSSLRRRSRMRYSVSHAEIHRFRRATALNRFGGP